MTVMIDDGRFEILDFVTGGSNSLFKIDDWIIKLEHVLKYHRLIHDLLLDIYSLMEEQEKQEHAKKEDMNRKTFNLLQEIMERVKMNRKIKVEMRNYFIHEAVLIKAIHLF